jgi:hypothetical protein
MGATGELSMDTGQAQRRITANSRWKEVHPDERYENKIMLRHKSEVSTSDSFNFSTNYVISCIIRIQGKLCREIPSVLHF